MRDKLRPRRSAEKVTPTMVANAEVFVNKDHRVTMRLAYQFIIGKASALSGDDLYKILAFYQILYHITLCDVYM